jgi:hypothetical protein
LVSEDVLTFEVSESTLLLDEEDDQVSLVKTKSWFKVVNPMKITKMVAKASRGFPFFLIFTSKTAALHARWAELSLLLGL